jgi:hypothetical protein
MPAGHAETRNIVFPGMARAIEWSLMKTLCDGADNISRAKPAVVQRSTPGFIAEWQQRGPETLSGLALRKLRLVLAPTQSVVTAGAVA